MNLGHEEGSSRVPDKVGRTPHEASGQVRSQDSTMVQSGGKNRDDSRTSQHPTLRITKKETKKGPELINESYMKTFNVPEVL